MNERELRKAYLRTLKVDEQRTLLEQEDWHWFTDLDASIRFLETGEINYCVLDEHGVKEIGGLASLYRSVENHPWRVALRDICIAWEREAISDEARCDLASRLRAVLRAAVRE